MREMDGKIDSRDMRGFHLSLILVHTWGSSYIEVATVMGYERIIHSPWAYGWKVFFNRRRRRSIGLWSTSDEEPRRRLEAQLSHSNTSQQLTLLSAFMRLKLHFTYHQVWPRIERLT